MTTKLTIPVAPWLCWRVGSGLMMLTVTTLLSQPLQAQGLLPEKPSIEVNLNALNALRGSTVSLPVPEAAPQQYYRKPPQHSAAMRTHAPQRTTIAEAAANPEMIRPAAQATAQQPAVPAAVAQMPSSAISPQFLPPPPPPLSARPAAPIMQRPMQNTVSMARPADAPRSVPVENAQVGKVAKPAPVAAAPKPQTPVVTGAAAAPKLPPFSAGLAPATVAEQKPALQPTPAVATPPVKPATAVAEAATVPPMVKPIAAPQAPLPDITAASKPQASVPAKPASAAATNAARADVDAIFASLDKAAATPPVASASATNPTVALKPLPAEAAKPTSPLPSPQAAEATAREVMLPLPTPATAIVAPIAVADAPKASTPVLPAPKDDAALKNLSDRVTSLFVKPVDKEGIVADRTVRTGPAQSLPALPPAERKPAAAPSNSTPPAAGSALEQLAKAASAAPRIPAQPAAVAPLKPVVADAAPKTHTATAVAAKPEQAKPEPVKKPPMLQAKPVVAAPALPDMPALPAASPATSPLVSAVSPSRAAKEKPPQLGLADVNKITPPQSLATPVPKPVTPKPVTPKPVTPKPVTPEPVAVPAIAPTVAPTVAPMVAPTVASTPATAVPAAAKVSSAKPVVATEVKPMAVPAAAPMVAPMVAPTKDVMNAASASAAVPATAPSQALMPGKLAALPSQPTATSKPKPTAADILNDILPPPSLPPSTTPAEKLPAAKAEVKAEKPAIAAPSSALPSLPSLSNATQPAASSLPSITAITGENQSSMAIVRDEQGVRGADIAPLAAATKSNTIPSLSPANDLPVVKRGSTEQKKPATPQMRPDQTPAASSAASPLRLPDLPPLPTASAAVASPEKPAPITLASNSVPESAQAVKPASVARAISLPAEAGVPALSVPFGKDKTDVGLDSVDRIGSIAAQAKSADKVRVVAYASGTPEQKSIARRISLSRALQVRAKLIEKGVDPMKITVQALGNDDGKSQDSAEIFIK